MLYVNAHRRITETARTRPMHWEREWAYCWSNKKINDERKAMKNGEQHKKHIKNKEILIYIFFTSEDWVHARVTQQLIDRLLMFIRPPPTPKAQDKILLTSENQNYVHTPRRRQPVSLTIINRLKVSGEIICVFVGNNLCFCQNQTQHTNADVLVLRQTAHTVTNGL